MKLLTMYNLNVTRNQFYECIDVYVHIPCFYQYVYKSRVVDICKYIYIYRSSSFTMNVNREICFCIYIVYNDLLSQLRLHTREWLAQEHFFLNDILFELFTNVPQYGNTWMSFPQGVVCAVVTDEIQEFFSLLKFYFKAAFSLRSRSKMLTSQWDWIFLQYVSINWQNCQ